ncbi:MAG: FAD-dependent oxidoreductase, partial [Pseudomonadota bacterium]|nr:FAD-dependent oxidoreductase [Pseudomonadota bacterium]
VAMTRAHIADPQIVNKLVAGQEDRIRPCVGATHCMSANRPTCLHNPATGRELKLPQVITPCVQGSRRVVVVGAGPAGLEAARVSAERGHQVILFEASNQLGGQVVIASGGSWRSELAGVIDWRVREITRLGVGLRLNTLVGVKEVMAQRPDVVIIATGGIPDIDFLEGGELCTTSWDLLTGQVPIENDVIVYDGTGRHVGPLCAEKVTSAGHVATLVGIDGLLAPELVYSERVVWRRQIFEQGVDTLFDHRLTSVSREDEGLRVCFTCELNGRETIRYTEQVVVEVGTQPVDELYQQLRPDSINDGVTDIDALLSGSSQVAGTTADTTFELHRIGDAVASRNI